MQAKIEKGKKVKFATQADAVVSDAFVDALRELASIEGRPIQVLVDEALREYLERKQGTRKHVMRAFENSMAKYDSLYKKLAQ